METQQQQGLSITATQTTVSLPYTFGPSSIFSWIYYEWGSDDEAPVVFKFV